MMFRVLVVDDNAAKRGRIIEVVQSICGPASVEVSEALTVNAAVQLLEKTYFDLAVIDVFLPMREDATPRREGGRILLETIFKQGDRLVRPRRIVGLTAFEDVHAAMESTFGSQGVQLIQFKEDTDEWVNQLVNILSYELGVAEGDPTDEYESDVCIMTALKTIELEAVLHLNLDWKPEIVQGDASQYHRGQITVEGQARSIIAAGASEMGMSSAAALATKMIYTFRPRYLVMCGIAAGVGLNYGDIVIADRCWDYGSGKFITEGDESFTFRPDPSYVAVDEAVKERIGMFIATRKDRINAIQGRWPGNPVDFALKAVLGPIASGAAVLENRRIIDSIKEHNRKVAAIEMEAFGVFTAGRVCSLPRPSIIVVKSVCDFGLPPKTDEFQRYAAFTSAHCTLELLTNCLP